MDTVAVYSAADADALHVQLATQAVCIGPAKATDSYLNVDALLTVARQTGCDALHPGYGFLSENAGICPAVRRPGADLHRPLRGCDPDHGQQGGRPCPDAGPRCPCGPRLRRSGCHRPGGQAAAEAIGYPVLVKASAGGGGRGMRRWTGLRS